MGGGYYWRKIAIYTNNLNPVVSVSACLHQESSMNSFRDATIAKA